MNIEAKRSVGRPREFDEEAVLTAAMDAFWCQGYEATSLTDLCDCTGLHKGSLYQAFGGKHDLFMRALAHYAQAEFDDVMAVASKADTPIDALRAAVLKICEDAGSAKGCLIINSIVELAPHDPAVKNAVQEIGSKRITAMTGLIAAAQDTGQIRAGLVPQKLARQLMLTLAGGASMVKALLSQEQLTETLEDLIDSWT